MNYRFARFLPNSVLTAEGLFPLSVFDLTFSLVGFAGTLEGILPSTVESLKKKK